MTTPTHKKCLAITELISLAEEKPLSLLQQIHLETHLFMCDGCKNFQKNTKTLSKMMKQFKEK